MSTPRVAHIALVALVLFAERAFADVLVDCGSTQFTSTDPSYSWTFQQGGGTVSVVGASFGNSASGAHTAAALMILSGMTVLSGTHCFYQIDSNALQAVKGTSLNNPLANGTVSAELHFHLAGEYKIHYDLGPAINYHAGSELSVFLGPFSQIDSFSVDGTGAILKTPALSGLPVTNNNALNGADVLVNGSFVVPVQLAYGTNLNMIQTNLANANAVLNSGASSAVYSGSMDAGSGTSYSYDIVSLDPNVVFTAVPEPATGFLTGAGVVALAVSRARRLGA